MEAILILLSLAVLTFIIASIKESRELREELRHLTCRIDYAMTRIKTLDMCLAPKFQQEPVRELHSEGFGTCRYCGEPFEGGVSVPVVRCPHCGAPTGRRPMDTTFKTETYGHAPRGILAIKGVVDPDAVRDSWTKMCEAWTNK